jgi:CDP-diacylglycerol--glycerol-3-phosphate 3-phosphatidyltransferase
MVKEKKEAKRKENIYNIPNALSIFRILISPVLIALVCYQVNIILIAVLFVIAALTDFADGFIARKYNLVTNFGRRADMIADRVLMISLVLALFIYVYTQNLINTLDIELIFLLMTREIFSAIFFIIAVFRKNSRPVPHARFAGKLTTTLQGFSFPMILLNWKIAPIFAILTAIAGIVCAGYYAYDAIIMPKNKFQVKLDKYYASLSR